MGQVALTCRGPLAPLGRSTCVLAPGVAAAAPGSCPAAPWLLLPGTEEAAAPSGKLAASSRPRSSLPALCPEAPRPQPPSLSPAGGAGELGRLHHLRGRSQTWAEKRGESSLSKGCLPCAASGRMLEPWESSGRSGSSHKPTELGFRLRPPLSRLPPPGRSAETRQLGAPLHFLLQGLSLGGGVVGCHQGERRRGAGLIASFLLSVNFHSEGSSQCLPFAHEGLLACFSSIPVFS